MKIGEYRIPQTELKPSSFNHIHIYYRFPDTHRGHVDALDVVLVSARY